MMVLSETKKNTFIEDKFPAAPTIEINTYKLDLDQFAECSPVPIQVRMRMALNNLGMKFEGDGTLSVIVDTDPQPLGKVTTWEEFENPNIRHYKQEITYYCDAYKTMLREYKDLKEQVVDAKSHLEYVAEDYGNAKVDLEDCKQELEEFEEKYKRSLSL